MALVARQQVARAARCPAGGPGLTFVAATAAVVD